MRKVMVATPSYDGKVTAEYIASLIESVKLGLQENINFIPVFVTGDAMVQRARNDLVLLAVESDITDIIWVDADQEWKPQWLIDLMRHDCDVVGGAVVKKSDDEQYNIKATPAQLTINEAGLMQVESVGTGFLRLSRKALLALWDAAEPYTNNGKEKRWVFEISIQGGDIMGEDVLLCHKLSELGFVINLDPKITCNHIGMRKWCGNFEAFSGRIKNA